MKALLVGALAATLIGCTCAAPPQTTYQCTSGYACPGPAAAQIDAEPVVFKAESLAANTHRPARTAAEKGANYTAAARIAPLPPAQLSDKPDPVIEKAKATVAAMMENPASAVFGEMKRAIRDVYGE